MGGPPSNNPAPPASPETDAARVRWFRLPRLRPPHPGPGLCPAQERHEVFSVLRGGNPVPPPPENCGRFSAHPARIVPGRQVMSGRIRSHPVQSGSHRAQGPDGAAGRFRIGHHGGFGNFQADVGRLQFVSSDDAPASSWNRLWARSLAEMFTATVISRPYCSRS